MVGAHPIGKEQYVVCYTLTHQWSQVQSVLGKGGGLVIVANTTDLVYIP